MPVNAKTHVQTRDVGFQKTNSTPRGYHKPGQFETLVFELAEQLPPELAAPSVPRGWSPASFNALIGCAS